MPPKRNGLTNKKTVTAIGKLMRQAIREQKEREERKERKKSNRNVTITNNDKIINKVRGFFPGLQIEELSNLCHNALNDYNELRYLGSVDAEIDFHTFARKLYNRKDANGTLYTKAFSLLTDEDITYLYNIKLNRTKAAAGSSSRPKPLAPRPTSPSPSKPVTTKTNRSTHN